MATSSLPTINIGITCLKQIFRTAQEEVVYLLDEISFGKGNTYEEFMDAIDELSNITNLVRDEIDHWARRIAETQRR